MLLSIFYVYFQSSTIPINVPLNRDAENADEEDGLFIM
jgi:hypothetical protein